ncbi:MAG TPA: hypothetical protein VG936_02930 [Lacunisphaera sp.]|nr:hypothetical protein [Lacunisphaera sp.]
MRIGTLEVKRRVWIGLAVAVVVTTAWWAWLRTRQPPIEPRIAAKTPFVQLAGTGNGAGDRMLRERVELMDPKPLFFPTEWNYGQRPLRESMRRQPGDVFGSFPPNLEFGGKGVGTYGTEGVAAPEKLADVLAQGNDVPFDGMGQVDTKITGLEPRSAFLEVRSLKNGDVAITQTLGNVFIPKSDFSPVEYLVAVSSAGVIGDPVLLIGAEGEEVDERVDSFFRSYLVKGARLGERLMPGNYRVSIGP